MFVFGQFSQAEYYSYLYLGNFSNRILFVFVLGDFLKPNTTGNFFLNTLNILLSIDTFDESVPILDKWVNE